MIVKNISGGFLTLFDLSYPDTQGTLQGLDNNTIVDLSLTNTFSEIYNSLEVEGLILGNSIAIIIDGVETTGAAAIEYFFTGGGASITDTERTAIATNSSKVSNKTHTGEVTGEESLILQPIAISNKTTIPATSGMEVLVNDNGTLKKVNAGDFLGAGTEVIKSVTAPTDTTGLWWRTTIDTNTSRPDNQLYFYDGSDWVSTSLYSTLFTEQGSSANNIFLSIGNIRTTLTRGWTIPFNLKIEYATWVNGTGNITQYLLYVNSAPIGTIPTLVTSRGTSNTNPPNLGISASPSAFLSVQYQGTNSNNLLVEIFYRRVVV
jgi:hypothetical protein